MRLDSPRRLCYAICVAFAGVRLFWDPAADNMEVCPLHTDIEQVLLTPEQIQAKVTELGRQISVDYKGKDLLAVGILKGAAIFFADLIRAIQIPAQMDFIAISSYGASSLSTGVHKIIKDLDQSITGQHVLLVEDIVDSGLTLRFLRDYLAQREAASVKTCVLLDKLSRRQIEVSVDYRGFSIPDEFVVGYGLDYSEKYRNLPYLGILRRDIYE